MKKFALVVATWFGSGLIPPVLLKGMAGTYGSFFSLPLCALLMHWSSMLHVTDGSGKYGIILGLAAAALILRLGLWSVPIAEKILGPRTDWSGRVKAKNQLQIVIDETLGIL